MFTIKGPRKNAMGLASAKTALEFIAYFFSTPHRNFCVELVSDSRNKANNGMNEKELERDPTVSKRSRKLPKCVDHFGRCLHEFYQHSFATDRKLVVAFGMDETNVKASSPRSNAARRKTHTLLLKPINRRSEVVHPKTKVVERRLMHFGASLRIDRLHQIDLDFERARSHRDDVLVHVFGFAAKAAFGMQAERIDPKPAQRRL